MLSAAMSSPDPLGPGTALCLSGGGYRAVLFNAGAVLRLAEAGLLGSVTRICGVSGGAIVAALVAAHWVRLSAEGFAPAAVRRELIEPLRALTSRTLDGRSVVGGLLFPRSLSEWIAHNFDRDLYRGVQFGDLQPVPRLSIGASQLNAGRRVVFGNEARNRADTISIGDPSYPLTDAVCASIAMPPAFPALRVTESDLDGEARRFVVQGVHMTLDGRPGKPWRADETRFNQLVFIGRDLDEARLRDGFRSCLVPA
jgi:NTE family protein